VQDLEALQRQARVAYERGRFATAARVAPVVVILTAICMAETGPVIRTGGLGLTLLVVATGLRWRLYCGFKLVEVGLWAGALPLLLATGLCRFAPYCPPDIAFALCGSVGVMSGVLIARESAHHVTATGQWFATLSVAILTATMGCAAIGLGTALGAASGVALGTAVTATMIRRVA
jgi:hypothetical protein